MLKFTLSNIDILLNKLTLDSLILTDYNRFALQEKSELIISQIYILLKSIVLSCAIILRIPSVLDEPDMLILLLIDCISIILYMF